jgi:hypothetical protein
MDNVEIDQDSEHQQGIKDVQKGIMSHEVAIISLYTFENPED